MTGRDAFTVVLRGFGCYLLMNVISMAAYLGASSLGLDVHLRNAPQADSFVAVVNAAVALVLLAKANTISNFLYKDDESRIGLRARAPNSTP